MTIENMTGKQREINERWLSFYCAPFDLADRVVRTGEIMGISTSKKRLENNQEFKNWKIEYIENFHSQIESSAIQYLERLKRNDLNFWKEEQSRDEFSFFICNQYFRTKRMRDSLIMSFENAKNNYEEFKDVRPENMWIPLSLIFSSNVGAHITHDYSAVLLQAHDDCFMLEINQSLIHVLLLTSRYLLRIWSCTIQLHHIHHCF